MPTPASVNYLQTFPPTQDHSNNSDRSPWCKGGTYSPKNWHIRSADPDYSSYQHRDLKSQTPTQHQMLCNNHSSGLTNWHARSTPCGAINISVYIPVRPRYDNTNRSSAQSNVQIHINVTTSVVKAFQQQTLLFFGEKNFFDPWVTAVENAAKLSQQDPINVAMTKLTRALLQVATCLWDRVVNCHLERASKGTC